MSVHVHVKNENFPNVLISFILKFLSQCSLTKRITLNETQKRVLVPGFRACFLLIKIIKPFTE